MPAGFRIQIRSGPVATWDKSGSHQAAPHGSFSGRDDEPERVVVQKVARLSAFPPRVANGRGLFRAMKRGDWTPKSSRTCGAYCGPSVRRGSLTAIPRAADLLAFLRAVDNKATEPTGVACVVNEFSWGPL
jgi:hypothetical protein